MKLHRTLFGYHRAVVRAIGRQYCAASTEEYAKNANNDAEYSTVIGSISSQLRNYLLRDVADDMMLDGVEPERDTFHSLTVGSIKRSPLQDAFYFRDEVKTMGLVPDVALYNFLISACGKCKNSDQAIRLLEEMKRFEVKPSGQTYTCLLDACAADGRLDRVFAIVRDMTAAGLGLNKFCYAGTIAAHRNRTPRLFDTASKSTVHFNVGQITHIRRMHTTSRNWNGEDGREYWNGDGSEGGDEIENKKFDIDLDDNIKKLEAIGVDSIGDSQTLCGRSLCAYGLKKAFHGEISWMIAAMGFYGRCCFWSEMTEVFRDMETRNAKSWHVLLRHIFRSHNVNQGLQSFGGMERALVNRETFFILLSGIVFSSYHGVAADILLKMVYKFYHNPDFTHYSTMVRVVGMQHGSHHVLRYVNMLGKSIKIPRRIQKNIWKSVIFFARRYADTEVGEFAVKELRKFGELDPSDYVAIAKYFAAIGNYKLCEEEYSMMGAKKMRKRPSSSK